MDKKKRLYIFHCETDDECCVLAYVTNSYKQALDMALGCERRRGYDSRFAFKSDLRGKRRKDIDASQLEYGEVGLEKGMEIGIYTGEL